MLRTLLESRASSPRRAGGTLFSVGVHTTTVGLAIVATARATPRPIADPPQAQHIVYTIPREGASLGRGTAGPKEVFYRIPRPVGRLIPPIEVPTPAPKLDFGSHLTNDDDFRGVVRFADLGPASGGLASESIDHVYDAPTVEKTAAPRAGNPAPLYPPSLRSASIEGVVLARFVVDTSGRAEPRSITFPEATYPLFAEAVRQALLQARYLPAMIGDRPVRQLVEQRFAFALTHVPQGSR